MITYLFDYEDEFEYTDQVIFSCGVNDLHKYKHTARSLFEFSATRLEYNVKAHPNTQFIFNSVLLTKISWLNDEINDFNKYMYRLCSSLPNLHYFDSDSVLRKARLEEVFFPRERDTRYGNGIHITRGARKLVVSELAKYLRLLARSKTRFPKFSS